MKLFLCSLAVTALVGVWMASVASSQLAILDQMEGGGRVTGALSNPINRTPKQDRLNADSPVNKMTGIKDNFCDAGGFDRACKIQIAGLKVSPPLTLAN